jgi:hypothetical protein
MAAVRIESEALLLLNLYQWVTGLNKTEEERTPETSCILTYIKDGKIWEIKAA